MADAASRGGVSIRIAGDVSGQIAVGDHITQVNAADGATVYVLGDGERPRVQARAVPVDVRPRPFPGLLDREQALAAASAALQAAEPVQIVGPPGIGKTAVLRRLSYEPVAEAFPDGVVFLSARGSTLDDLLDALYHAFYETDVPFRPTFAEVAERLKAKRAIVLLDDVELGRESLGRVLDVVPRCAVAAALPERRLFGEARSVVLDGLPEAEALALVERGLERALETAEREAGSALARALGGHPLAILQQVAPVRDGVRTLQAAAEQARSAASVEALAGDVVGARPKRQRRLLAVLAAFAGAAFSAERAGALADLELVSGTGSGADSLLADLVRDGLVVAERDRYRIAENLVEALGADLDLAALLERVLPHCAEWLAARGADRAAVLPEADLLEAVLGRAAEAGHWREVLDLGRALEPSLMLEGRWGAWQRVLDLELDAARALADRAAEAWALHQTGSRALGLDEVETARRALGEALEIREALGDRPGVAVTRHNLDVLAGTVPPSGTSQEGAPESGRAGGHAAIDADQGDGGGGGGPSWATKLGVGGIATAVVVGAVGYHVFLRAPDLELASRALAFGERTVGAEARLDLALRNAGPTTLEIRSVRIQGPDAGDFRVAENSCTLARGISRERRCSLTVAFTPGQAGERRAHLVLSSNAAGGAVRIDLGGVGTSPVVVEPGPALPVLDRAMLAFGEVTIGGRSRAQVVTLSNRGESGLGLAGVSHRDGSRSEFVLEADECSGTVLAPGRRCALAFVFAPTAAGDRRASFAIRTDASPAPEPLQLTGVGRFAPEPLVIEPERLDFGTLAPRESRRAELRLSNRGRGEVAIGAIRLAADDTGAFRLSRDKCDVRALPAGRSCTLVVDFAPRREGQREALLIVETDAPGSPQRVVLAGSARALPTPPNVGPSPVDFGARPVKGPEALARVEIENPGAAPVRIGPFELLGAHPGDFRVLRSECPDALAPREGCRVVLGFSPSVPGQRSATLLVNDDAQGLDRGVVLVGEGLAALPVPRPLATARPTRLEFEQTELGRTSRPQQVVLVSHGDTAVGVARLRIEGRDASEFHVTHDGCSERDLAPERRCQVELVFGPRRVGARRATLVVETSSAAGASRVALEGQGRGKDVPTPRPPVPQPPVPLPRPFPLPLPLPGLEPPAPATPAKPDLVVGIKQAAQIRTEPDGSYSLLLSLGVRNVGRASAGPFKVTVLLGGQSYPWSGSQPSPVPAGGTATLRAPLRLAGTLAGTSIALSALVDSCIGDEFMPEHCRVDELDEGNNRSNTLQLGVPGKPAAPVLRLDPRMLPIDPKVLIPMQPMQPIE